MLHNLIRMKEIIDFLTNSKMQYLASIGLDGKPKVRPFQFMLEDDSKLWFCTSNRKEVYKELKKNAFVEICASGSNMSWMRLKAKAVFSDNMHIKEKILEHSPLVKSIYREAANPGLEVFYLEGISASIAAIGVETRTIEA